MKTPLVDNATLLPTRKVVAGTLGAVLGVAIAQWSGMLAVLSPWLTWLNSEPVTLAAPILGAALAGCFIRERATAQDAA